MIKTIKNLFSVDESELDIDEVETSNEKYSLYKQELEQNKENENNPTAKINVVEVNQNNLAEEQVKTVEIDDSTGKIISPNQTNFKAIDNTSSDTLNHNVIMEEKNYANDKKSFDFAKEIEKEYEKNDEAIMKEQEKEQEKQKEVNKEKEVTKENYVLKDIISPMRGVVRKEEKTIKRNDEVRRAQIIKLREQVKTTEIDQEEKNDNTMEYNFAKSKNITIFSDVPENHESLSETSKFTMVEDATGEIKLVIDEKDLNE